MDTRKTEKPVVDTENLDQDSKNENLPLPRFLPLEPGRMPTASKITIKRRYELAVDESFSENLNHLSFSASTHRTLFKAKRKMPKTDDQQNVAPKEVKHLNNP